MSNLTHEEKLAAHRALCRPYDVAELKRLRRRGELFAAKVAKKAAAKKVAAKKSKLPPAPKKNVQVGFNPYDPVNRAGAYNHQLRLRYQED